MDQNCINRLPRQAGAGSWSNGLKCTLVSVGTSVILRIHIRCHGEREETFESRGSEAKRKILCWTCGKATTHEVTWRFGGRCFLCRDCGEIVVEKLDSFQKE